MDWLGSSVTTVSLIHCQEQLFFLVVDSLLNSSFGDELKLVIVCLKFDILGGNCRPETLDLRSF